jgi:hypothetical protein
MKDKLSVYHVIVTLRDVSRAITQPREEDITQLCTEVVSEHPTLKDETDSLKAWLAIRRSG